ncbi:DNA-protecting protein DprA [Pararhizobium sp. BT-229]|uniref:DNA-protecting protein DprA n=1 Tax=Pararhizobium sp. BT-229 TaxID=2986923 RepID=UPI0021F6D8AF|nr:DNA-protecting protein DprA [Pararhizobium sp. BT-229]MCV9960408.1 DNA-protecting protein DprA [Pararhizobium sp. BT-229]
MDKPVKTPKRRNGYVGPTRSFTDTLQNLLQKYGRSGGGDGQFDLLRSYGAKDVFVYCAGDIRFLASKVVSIVGTREISEAGIKRANRLSRELAEMGVVVMSGLAKGVDSVAHLGAINAGGKTAAVIGTPLDRAYPAENAQLQMDIYNHHLLISPFGVGEEVYRSNFPTRNRVMALLSDATVIVEASDTSGTLHQAVECQKNGRWLFIMKSVAEDPKLSWPAKFLNHPRTRVLESTSDIVEALR